MTKRWPEQEKTGMKCVWLKQNVGCGFQWEGDDCDMIAILKKTMQAPSCHTEKPGWKEEMFFHNNHTGSQPRHYPGQQKQRNSRTLQADYEMSS